MKNPKISIITVSYNSGATIEDTIKSVVSQDYQNLEYIIVDGKSSDNTLEIANKYKDKITKIVSEKDDGIFDAFNKGLKLASGDIIGILNSDDFYTDNTVISSIAEAFEKNNTDTLYGDLVYVNAKDTNNIVRYWQSCDYQKSLFEFGWMPPHPTFFVKKELYQKYGDFNTWMKISNDYELVLRFLYKHNCTSQYLPKILVKMRDGGNSNGSLKTRYNANMEDRESWKVNELKMPFYSMYMKPLRKISQYFIPKKINLEV